VSLPNVPVYLDADPVRLAQVYTNLLNNAAKYTERGGRIDVSARLMGEDVVLTVKDSGTANRAVEFPCGNFRVWNARRGW